MILLFILSLLITPGGRADYAVKVTSYNPPEIRPIRARASEPRALISASPSRRRQVIALSQDLVGRAKWKPFKYHTSFA